MKKPIILTALYILISIPAIFAAGPMNVRFHDETADTTLINSILVDLAQNDPGSPGERVAMLGQKFIGTPYVAHTLEAPDGEDERLTVNLSELDCTTFVETVFALAKTVGEGRTSWRDFVNNLESIRYRGGELNGYPSRLHYIADWIVDNTYRGNIIDATNLFPAISYTTKSIDFMSTHRDNYPALKDSLNFERVKSTELGYRNHRFPFVKTRNLSELPTRQAFRNGDAVALTSSLKDLDVTHLGLIIIVDGEPHLLHASSSLGKVVLSDEKLADFIKRNRSLTGVRIMRLKD